MDPSDDAASAQGIFCIVITVMETLFESLPSRGKLLFVQAIYKSLHILPLLTVHLYQRGVIHCHGSIL